MKLKRDRIAQAIEVLEYVYEHRAHKFDLDTWLTLSSEEEADLLGKEKPVPVAINGCGTHACALGWIASDPFAIRRGLHVEFDPSDYSCGVLFHGDSGIRAAMEYFGITEETADLLFLPTYYRRTRGRPALRSVIIRMRCLLDAPTPELGEIAVADACTHTGVDEYEVEHLLIGEELT